MVNDLRGDVRNAEYPDKSYGVLCTFTLASTDFSFVGKRRRLPHL